MVRHAASVGGWPNFGRTRAFLNSLLEALQTAVPVLTRGATHRTVTLAVATAVVVVVAVAAAPPGGVPPQLSTA
jgi:hypothetical protein